MRRDRKKIVGRGWLIVGTTAVLSVFLTLFVLARVGFFGKAAPPDGSLATAGHPAASRVSRKNIYDCNQRPLAVGFRLTSIYARPLEFNDIDATAGKLASVLAVDAGQLQSLLKTERSFVWLARQLPPEQADKIVNPGMAGVYGIDEMVRFYPHCQAAAHVLGFVKEDQGLAGVEFFYDNVLRGTAGPDLDLINAGLGTKKLGSDGADLVLTLDLRLQELLEQQLARLVDDTKAASAEAILMDPASGAIRAMANLPAYDPNRFWDYTASVRRNRAVTDPVFPGGLGRIFQAGALYQQEGNLVLAPEGGAGPWVAGREGEWFSPALDRLPAWTGPAPALNAFADRLGVNGATGIDLPDEQSEGLDGAGGNGQPFRPGEAVSSTSALRLLTGFARLLGNGAALRPHLLAAVRDGRGERPVTLPAVGKAAPLAAGSGAAVLRALGGLDDAGHQRLFTVEAITAEGLVDNRAAGSGKNEAGIEEESRAVATPAAPQAAVQPVAGQEAAAPTAAAQGAVLQPAAAPPARYYATLLGGTPAPGGSLALVVALSGASIEPTAASPLAAMGEQVLHRAAIVSGQRDNGKAGEARGEEYYQAWRKLQVRPDAPPAETPVRLSESMPTVTGASLRKALQMLQPYGLPIRVVGGGRVVGQQPAAGTSLKGSKEIVLKLGVDQ